MTCRQVDEVLMESGNRKPRVTSSARDHLRWCERCRSVVGWMEGMEPVGAVDPSALKKIEDRLLTGLKPVRPLAPDWIWVSVFVLLAGMICASGAWLLGMQGLRAASPLQRTVIFCTLGLGAASAANIASREMTPGKPRKITAWHALGGSGLALLLAFGLLFRNYDMENFVGSGVRCLATGLCFSIGTGLPIGLLLRRGFMVDTASAGLAAGTLAGLTGLAVLELHCPNLSATHVMLWHLAVLAVSGAAGWLAGHTARGSGSSLPDESE